jgi:NADH:ubiquinone oxidoreductase subunit F (NADH-binding)
LRLVGPEAQISTLALTKQSKADILQTRAVGLMPGAYKLEWQVLAVVAPPTILGGYLGADVMGLGFDFDLELRIGAGAYICGEETALFNSLEGFRGEPRSKPPFPVEVGLFGQPTLVNNVETLINVLPIVLHGGQAFAATGISRKSWLSMVERSSKASTSRRCLRAMNARRRPGRPPSHVLDPSANGSLEPAPN